MSPSERTPHTPASLATDGEQGAGAKACSQCGWKDTARAACLRAILMLIIEVLSDLRDSFALDVEIPPEGFLEARDMLDGIREQLVQRAQP